MVSFWPFGGDETSAASFEKSLSELSTKINNVTARNDRLRLSKRNGKAFLTLYMTFAYIIVALILILVTGWQTWGTAEYSAVASGPVLIYGLRLVLDTYYNYRIANSQNRLNELQKQRETTIEKLKTATKYNSTQQLLEKYGGQNKPASTQTPKKRRSEGPQSKPNTAQTGRVGTVPPPTANVPRRQPPPTLPNGPNGPNGGVSPAPAVIPQPGSAEAPEVGPQISLSGPSEEFAPNAFSNRPQLPTARQPSFQYAPDGQRWYDRILDIVLGEDETASKNRIALICQDCRIVNGQAPPGARTPEDIGRWRCGSCGAWNGVESEEKKLLNQLTGEPVSPTLPISSDNPHVAMLPENEDGGFSYSHASHGTADSRDADKVIGNESGQVPLSDSTMD